MSDVRKPIPEGSEVPKQDDPKIDKGVAPAPPPTKTESSGSGPGKDDKIKVDKEV